MQVACRVLSKKIACFLCIAGRTALLGHHGRGDATCHGLLDLPTIAALECDLFLNEMSGATTVGNYCAMYFGSRTVTACLGILLHLALVSTLLCGCEVLC